QRAQRRHFAPIARSQMAPLAPNRGASARFVSPRGHCEPSNDAPTQNGMDGTMRTVRNPAGKPKLKPAYSPKPARRHRAALSDSEESPSPSPSDGPPKSPTAGTNSLLRTLRAAPLRSKK